MVKFELGDKVVLKAGSSPIMLIDVIKDNGEIHCVWYSKQDNDYRRRVFNNYLLEKYEPKIVIPTQRKSQFRQKLENYC